MCVHTLEPGLYPGLFLLLRFRDRIERTPVTEPSRVIKKTVEGTGSKQTFYSQRRVSPMKLQRLLSKTTCRHPVTAHPLCRFRSLTLFFSSVPPVLIPTLTPSVGSLISSPGVTKSGSYT